MIVPFVLFVFVGAAGVVYLARDTIKRWVHHLFVK